MDIVPEASWQESRLSDPLVYQPTLHTCTFKSHIAPVWYTSWSPPWFILFHFFIHFYHFFFFFGFLFSLQMWIFVCLTLLNPTPHKWYAYYQLLFHPFYVLKNIVVENYRLFILSFFFSFRHLKTILIWNADESTTRRKKYQVNV